VVQFANVVDTVGDIESHRLKGKVVLNIAG
jgi:hypothetical protein